MKCLSALLAFAVFMGAGHSIGNAAMTPKPADRLRTVEPAVRPGVVKPDQTRPLQPRIKPGMLGHGCPQHLQNSRPDRFDSYSCRFGFRVRCGAGEEIWRGPDDRGPAEVRVDASLNRVSIEYYCLDKENPEPARRALRSLSGAPSVSQPAGPKARAPFKTPKPGKPPIRPGMSALDCASHFQKHHVAERGYTRCRFDFKPACGPGQKVSVNALGKWWRLIGSAFADDFAFSYGCVAQRR